MVPVESALLHGPAAEAEPVAEVPVIIIMIIVTVIVITTMIITW